MLDANTFENPNLRGTPSNPYAPNREVVESSERLIERLEPKTYPQEDQSVPTREFTDGERASMKSVKTGLQFYYSGIYLVTFCFFVGGFLGRVIGPQMATLVGYGTTLGILIVLLGEIRCLAIPRETGGFRHVLISVLFYSCGVLLYVMGQAFQGQGNGAARVFFFQIGMLQLLFGFLANYFFLTFIICLTRFLNHQALYQKAVKTRNAIWSMVGFFFIVLFIFLVLLNQLPKNGQQLAFIVFGLGVLGFVILVYSWLNRFTRLVQETCSAIVLESPSRLDDLAR